jgi:hypothetical protein
MIHVVVMKCLIGLPLLMHIELYGGVGSFKNRGVGVELLCTDSTLQFGVSGVRILAW